jgi:NACHT domain/TIR domain
MKQRQRRVVLFYSCHPSDDILCDKLAQLLRPLVREGYVEQWSARQILPGIETAQETKRALESATHILLLLSAEYLAEDVCCQEMFSALERQKNGARVIPIRLRPFLLTRELEASLPSFLPENGRPVSTWKKREEALDEVARGICHILGLPLATLRRRSANPDRDCLLDRVFKWWVEGVLEPSLQGRMPLDLPLQEQPDVLANPDELINPWPDEVQELKRVLRPLSVEMSIIQAYDDADGELLILGEPGAGKTTLLLELTRMLLKRAEKGDGARMPVVFPLSSWAKEKQALGTWLVEELKERYGIPRKIGKRWIDNNAILPLLDGLDEVAESARTACVQAIEAYHTEVQRELVVCCRREEYLALPRRLRLQRAVCIQQLTDNQVEHYLRQAEQNTDQQLQGLRQGLHGNRELNEFVRTPLMLNIVTFAYQEAQASEVPAGKTPEEMQRIIFARYVKRLFNRRGITTNYTPEQTTHHLTWLARQMVRDDQMGFYIEQMQPDWLPSSGAYRLYRGITTVIFAMLFFAAVGLLVGQLPGLGFGLVSGGLIGILNGALNLILRFTWRKTWSWLRLLIKCCCFGLVGGLAFALLFRLAVGQFHGQDLGSTNGLLFGGIAAVFGLFVDRVLGAPDMNIKPAEVVTWSWKRMRRSLILFLCLGLAGGIIFALFFRYVRSGIAILLLGLYFGLILGLFFGLIRGWSSQEVENKSRTTPNQGIWRSARNGLRIGLRAGAVVGLIFGLSIGLIAIKGLAGNPMLLGINIVPDAGLTISGWLEFAILIGLLFMLISGLFTAFVAGLLSGWDAWIKHFVLRFLLSCRGYLPWRLSSFLDYAAERIFLRKVGGGYFFIHRFLRDHFASLETPSSQDVSTVSMSPQKSHEKE